VPALLCGYKWHGLLLPLRGASFGGEAGQVSGEEGSGMSEPKKEFCGWALLVGLAIAIAWASTPAASAPWRSECFRTLDELVAGMNRRSPAEMHVVTVPSERNYGGFLGSPYCMVSR
jgi:hypothetical protein